MTGYKIKYNGIDRLYNAYSWRLTRRAKAAWSSGQVLQGQFLKQLETEIAEKYNRKYAVGIGSATDGLYFAMRAVGLNKGSTVMCPVLSYIATANAIKRLGAKIQFVDTDQMGLIGDLQYKEVPDAVVYVNLFGNCADYVKLRQYCTKHKIPLIEDAAQSQGAIFKKIPSGALGDISVFSFDPMKNMPSFGGGGMVLTDDEKQYKQVLSMRKNGTYNSVLSEDHANQLLLILDKFKKLQNMRKKVYQRYREHLPNAHFLIDEKGKPSYHKLVMITKHRDALQKHLAEAGIETKIHYKEILDSKYVGLYSYPCADSICANAISLPIYPYLKNDEIDYICETIGKFDVR